MMLAFAYNQRQMSRMTPTAASFHFVRCLFITSPCCKSVVLGSRKSRMNIMKSKGEMPDPRSRSSGPAHKDAEMLFDPIRGARWVIELLKDCVR